MITVVICTPSLCYYLKAIKKLNNIVIARLTTNRRPNILSNTWRFDTFADSKMLGEKFEIWPADPLFNATLIIIGTNVTYLGYLKDRSPCFTKLTDNDMKESKRILIGLDTIAIILQPDNEDLPDLIDLKAKRTNKKKEKAERHQ